MVFFLKISVFLERHGCRQDAVLENTISFMDERPAPFLLNEHCACFRCGAIDRSTARGASRPWMARPQKNENQHAPLLAEPTARDGEP
ncbi:MAG: hypothetical protein QG599_886 [Pseudomonadota bacterium]|nr:hypothetical protein [Pseudomonadota bacterium]